MVALLSLNTLNLLRRLFNKKSHKKFSVWTLIVAFIIAFNFAPNAYIAEEIAKIYVGPINVILFGIVPLIALIVGKIRRVV